LRPTQRMMTDEPLLPSRAPDYVARDAQ